MHWFWRGAIAIGVGLAYGGVANNVLALNNFHYAVWTATSRPAAVFWGNDFGNQTARAVAYILPLLLVAFACYGVLTHYFRPEHLDPETRCRKCGYILRGLSEPRCSECGEGI
jgi:hypothetical protein